MRNSLILSNLVRGTALAITLCAPTLHAQGSGFSSQNVISTGADRARDVYTIDVDSDGDLDALSASSQDDKVAWYENLGGGSFGPEEVISITAGGPYSLHAADFDGDGMEDVVSAGDGLQWYPNLGGGNFGGAVVIDATPANLWEVFTSDLDSDGDPDVLTVDIVSGLVSWYENLGAGSFGLQQAVSTALNAPKTVHAADLDQDGDKDVLSAAAGLSPKVIWFENLGGGIFGPEQVISTEGGAVHSILSIDLDGDGDSDVLTAGRNDSTVAWYENLSNGQFGARQIISSAAPAATSVLAADFDGDGDADVAYGGIVAWDNIGWFENQGSGLFGPLRAIVAENSSDVIGLWAIHAADLDGDGRPEVMSASSSDDKIAWWSNLVEEFPISVCHGDGGDPVGCTNCPCGNDSLQGTEGGCVNSAGTSCRLLPTGTMSVFGADLRFRADGAPPFSTALLVSGNQLLPANPANPCFGSNGGTPSLVSDGLRCVGSGLLRHGTRSADATGAIGVTGNGWGSEFNPSGCAGPCPVLNFTEPLLGATKYFQLFYRDDPTALCQQGQNSSQAVIVTFRN